MSRIMTSLLFDMRAPAFGAPRRELYAAALDMAQFADEIGITAINLMEHHGSEDGYLPQPFVLGGGIAARTKRCRLILGAVVLPLHDPVKVAEQIAVLDIMSQGRLNVTIGAGYVPSEFAAFGASLRHRGRLVDEGIEIILRALGGERFDAPDGRPVNVRPLPLQAPTDILLVGGGVEASARRAARFGLGFSPMRPDLIELYDSECERLGKTPGRKLSPRGISGVHLAQSVEQGWAEIMPHVRHVIDAYAAWAEQEPNSNSPFRGLLGDENAIRRSGMFTVMTPEELVRRAPAEVDEFGTVSLAPLLGGLSPEIGWKSLKLLGEIMPKLMRPDASELRQVEGEQL